MTKSTVVQTEKRPCAKAILEEDLPTVHRVRDVQVWGDQALIRFDDDNLFLSQFPHGWKVVAAGCTPQGHKPYDCQVDGA